MALLPLLPSGFPSFFAPSFLTGFSQSMHFPSIHPPSTGDAFQEGRGEGRKERWKRDVAHGDIYDRIILFCFAYVSKIP
jgi:hypothetical protein